MGRHQSVTSTTALLANPYPPEQINRILGLNVAVAAASSVCGPLIGGALVTWFGWRALLLAGVPLGAWSFFAGRAILQESRAGLRETFDLPGAILSFVALGSLVMALSEGGALGWRHPAILAGFAPPYWLAGHSRACKCAGPIPW